MSISELTRKILWVESGGRCAVCRRQLLAPGVGFDEPSVIGEEAHIVSRAGRGPRAAKLSKGRVDHHSNLILLCREHHKQVDDQVLEFTVARLHEIKEQHRQWVAQLGEAERTPSSVQVTEADPFLLGVHRAIEVPGVTGTELPTYITRDTDLDSRRGLRALLTNAKSLGCFILVTGGSSTGKTRFLYEATRSVLPDWPLVHPTSSQEVRDLACMSLGRLVIWLDELHRYLRDGDALDRSVIRRLLQAAEPVVIVGTLWPSDHATFTQRPAPGAPDLCERERSVVELATCVTLPERFTPAELDRAARSDDRRVQAVLKIKDHDFTQAMAAAPQLLERWEHADDCARAVISAALDVARLGVRSPIPAAVLRAAAPGYCDDRTRARADRDRWFDRALKYATSELKGAASVLAPVDRSGTLMGEPYGYQIADYLLDTLGPCRLSTPLPETFWWACRILAPADARRIGQAAQERLRYEPAARLYERACQDVTDTDAARRLAHLYSNAGRHRDAADVLWPTCRLYVDNALVHATLGTDLAIAMARAGRLDWLAAQAEAGDDIAAESLADALAEQADEEGLLDRWRMGDTYAADRLAGIWLESNRRAEAIELLEELASRGVELPAVRLSDIFLEKSQPEEAIRVLSPAAGANGISAPLILARLLADTNRHEEAYAVLHERIRERDPSSIELWVDIMADDDLDAALSFLKEEADTGNALAVQELARLLSRVGRPDEAVDELRATSEPSTRRMLFRLLIDAGRHAEAQTVVDAMIEANDVAAPQALAESLAATGDHALLADLARLGLGEAAVLLAQIWTADGRESDAEDLLRTGVVAGNAAAVRGWVTHLVALGRTEEADNLRRYGLTADGRISTGINLPKTHPKKRRAAAKELLMSGQRPTSSSISMRSLWEAVQLSVIPTESR